jgi:hypothetical protein
MTRRKSPATKAWATRHTPTYKARKSEARSKDALRDWAKSTGWRVVFFESRTGFPRTGIVDAVLLRLRPKQPDTVELRLLQLKSESAGLTATESRRLRRAAQGVDAQPLVILHSRGELDFWPAEPL